MIVVNLYVVDKAPLLMVLTATRWVLVIHVDVVWRTLLFQRFIVCETGGQWKM